MSEILVTRPNICGIFKQSQTHSIYFISIILSHQLQEVGNQLQVTNYKLRETKWQTQHLSPYYLGLQHLFWSSVGTAFLLKTQKAACNIKGQPVQMQEANLSNNKCTGMEGKDQIIIYLKQNLDHNQNALEGTEEFQAVEWHCQTCLLESLLLQSSRSRGCRLVR